MNPHAINQLRQELLARKLDAVLITKKVNVNYLSGFTGEGQALVTAAKKTLFVDFRYQQQAEESLPSWQICQRSSFQPLAKTVVKEARRLRLKSLGFEPLAVSYNLYYSLRQALKPVRLVAAVDLVEKLRAIKSQGELRLIRQAFSLAAATLSYARKIIKPGLTELAIARKAQYFMQAKGADACAFESIIASGKRSSLPHAQASAKKIRHNEAVLVDLGCCVCGYNSDLTRMFFLGKISGKIKRIYNIVVQAQALAIKAIRPGVKISEIDKAARRHIAKYGLGNYFGHSLGHGIGKEVHEYPCVSAHNEDTLKPGMIITIEPGVYIPNLGGVRVEDMVLVTKTGAELLVK